MYNSLGLQGLPHWGYQRGAGTQSSTSRYILFGRIQLLLRAEDDSGMNTMTNEDYENETLGSSETGAETWSSLVWGLLYLMVQD